MQYDQNKMKDVDRVGKKKGLTREDFKKDVADAVKEGMKKPKKSKTGTNEKSAATGHWDEQSSSSTWSPHAIPMVALLLGFVGGLLASSGICTYHHCIAWPDALFLLATTLTSPIHHHPDFPHTPAHAAHN